MLLCFYVNLRCCTTSFMDSLFMRTYGGFTAAWQSGGAAGATHVQISWISAWIPSEVTRTFFFSIFPYGIQIQVHFHVGHFLAKGNQQLLVPLFVLEKESENGNVKFEVDAHQLDLRLHHSSQFSLNIKKIKSWQVCDWLAKWLIMSGRDIWI